MPSESIPCEGTGEGNGRRVEEGGVVVLGAEAGVYVDEGTGEGVVRVLVCVWAGMCWLVCARGLELVCGRGCRSGCSG